MNVSKTNRSLCICMLIIAMILQAFTGLHGGYHSCGGDDGWATLAFITSIFCLWAYFGWKQQEKLCVNLLKLILILVFWFAIGYAFSLLGFAHFMVSNGEVKDWIEGLQNPRVFYGC